MAKVKNYLTTEHLRKKFKNNFDLCNFSIAVAQNALLAGTQASFREILAMVEDRANSTSL